MSESILYIIGSLIILLISFILFRRAAGSLNLFKPNMISYIFYFNLILEMFIGSTLVVLKIDNHYMFNNINDETRIQGWLIVNYTLITLPIGMLFAKWIFVGKNSMKSLLDSYISKPINIQYLGKGLKYSIWCFTIVSALACIYTFLKIGYIPVIKALQGGDLATLRISVSRNFTGNEYIKNLLALNLMPILSYAWCFYYLQNKKLSNLSIFIITVILSINILYYNFAKAPVLWYFLSYIFVYFYAFGRINKKYLIVAISIVFLLLTFFYSLNGINLTEFINYNSGPIGRIILSQAGGLYTMLEVFPKNFDYLGFSSISQAISNLFQLDYSERAARIAMEYFNPRGVAAGTAGVMNSLFMGEAWANFGILGVITSPFWIGFCIQSLYLFFLKSYKSPIYLAFLVSFSFGGSITGGFNDYLYNPTVVIYSIMLASIIFLAIILNNASSKYK